MSLSLSHPITLSTIVLTDSNYAYGVNIGSGDAVFEHLFVFLGEMYQCEISEQITDNHLLFVISDTNSIGDNINLNKIKMHALTFEPEE